jgi:hypothetical protein
LPARSFFDKTHEIGGSKFHVVVRCVKPAPKGLKVRGSHRRRASPADRLRWEFERRQMGAAF